MTIDINVTDRTVEEWNIAQAQGSLWYTVLVLIVGFPLDLAGVASTEVIIGVALLGYALMTAHFVNQIFLQSNHE